MAFRVGRNCCTRASTRSCFGLMTAGSSVSGVALLMAARRASSSVDEREWCSAEKGLQGRSAGLLHVVERRPSGEEVAEHNARFLLEPIDNLREVVLEGALQAVSDARLVANEPCAFFEQTLECAHASALRFQGLQLVAVAQEDLERDFRIRGIGLGMTWLEGLAVFCQRCRIDREEHEEIILLQRIDQRTSGNLKTHRHRFAIEALSEGAGPLRQWPSGNGPG